MFYLAHELRRPVAEIIELSTAEIQGWQAYFTWKYEEEQRQAEKARQQARTRR